MGLSWYGRSAGSSSQPGIYQDSLAALEKGRELHKGQGLFIVYGQSLGGAISMRALPDFRFKDDVDLLVHDSSFVSYQDVGFNVLKSRWFLLPFGPLAFVLISDKYSAEKFLDQIKCPTLVINGERDRIIPAKLGRATYEKLATDRKWLWELPEVGHIDVFHVAAGRYRANFLELLDQIAPQ